MENSKEIYEGSKRFYGLLSDLFKIRHTSLIVTDRLDTPDLYDPVAGTLQAELESFVRGPQRLSLDLDHGYITQTVSRHGRPIPFSFESETHLPDELRTVEGEEERPGLNQESVGALARLSDIIHISIAEPADAVDSGVEPRIWNDRFGIGVVGEASDLIEPTEPNSDLVHGRGEIRTSAHYWLNELHTGPINFRKDSGDEFPKDCFDPVKYRVMSRGAETDFEIGGDLRGEFFTGAMMFNRQLRCWVPVCGINPKPCDLPTPVDDDDTLDERVDAFGFDCLVEGFGGPNCSIPEGCGPITCAELGLATIQERFIILADRFNCLRFEIDKMHCIMRCVITALNTAKLAEGIEPTVTSTCCADDIISSTESGIG
jgi:hypothetical protein